MQIESHKPKQKSMSPFFLFLFLFLRFPPSYLFLATNRSKDYAEISLPPSFLNTIFEL